MPPRSDEYRRKISESRKKKKGQLIPPAEENREVTSEASVESDVASVTNREQTDT